MAQYTAVVAQTVQPGQGIVFTVSDFPCQKGYVRHTNNTPSFVLSGASPSQNPCGCRNTRRNAVYHVCYGADIAVASDGTPGEISIGLAKGSSVIPASVASATPTVAEAYFSVSKTFDTEVWSGCCTDVSLINTSTQPIIVKNVVINMSRPDLLMSY